LKALESYVARRNARSKKKNDPRRRKCPSFVVANFYHPPRREDRGTVCLRGLDPSGEEAYPSPETEAWRERAELSLHTLFVIGKVKGVGGIEEVEVHLRTGDEMRKNTRENMRKTARKTARQHSPEKVQNRPSAALGACEERLSKFDVCADQNNRQRRRRKKKSRAGRKGW